MTVSAKAKAGIALLLALVPMACAPAPDTAMNFATTLPATRWDHRPEADDWTRATLEALKAEGAPLLSTTPADIATFCPGYAEAGPDQRAAFWAGMFSAIAKYESTWNPAASGAGGRYLGLMQISPQTARGAGCDLSQGGLRDGASNLECAVRIAARRAPAGGGVVSGPGALAGLTNDWGPMHKSGYTAEMAAWTKSQSYCQKPAAKPTRLAKVL